MPEELISKLKQLLEAEARQTQLRFECIRQGEELDRLRLGISQELHQRKLGTFSVGFPNRETVLCMSDLEGKYTFHKITNYDAPITPDL